MVDEMSTQYAHVPPRPSSAPLVVDLPDEAATEALGRRLADLLETGGTVLLSGDLGAGKSALARAMVRSVTDDPAREVPSPSYTLVNRHDTDAREVWHADLYRLAGPDETAELGLEEAARTALVLIEWPDRLDDVTRERLPRPCLAVHLERTSQDLRLASIRPLEACGAQQALRALKHGGGEPFV